MRFQFISMFLYWGVVIFQLCYVLKVQGQVFNPRPSNERNKQTSNVAFPGNFSIQYVRVAFEKARKNINLRRETVAENARTIDSRQNIASARNQMFHRMEPLSQRSELEQERFEEATKILVDRFKLTSEQLRKINLKLILSGDIVKNCEAQFNKSLCRDNYPYRTFDGSCNNLQNPSWGRASTCFQRLLDPDYADDISAKRVSVSGEPLPNSRSISSMFHTDSNRPTNFITHMFMAFGQFITNDISLTPQSGGPNNLPLECCPVGEDDPPQCDPILLGQDDPFYSSYGINCLNNIRSAKCSTCSLGPRQQINQLSSYIDASHLYGLNRRASAALRNNDGTGTMRSISISEVGELPPPSSKPDNDSCSFQDPNLDCFELGDQRANQHPALTSLYILFLREHNRIARILRQLNGRWTEERLFQETRRIVGAMLQMIIYNEYLPLVLGTERMRFFHLYVRTRVSYTKYDKTVKASLFNEFATAAFRFGHSLINSNFLLKSEGSLSNYRLQDNFMYPFNLYRGQFDGLINGLTDSPAQFFDRHIVRDVTNHLYQYRGNHTGLDLASLNINRGRDHGIPSYTRMVEYCGGPKIRDWNDLDILLVDGARQRFEFLYGDVRDIDLFSGGLAERPGDNAVIGPTFSCVVGTQFFHLKYGDRFYFEHGDQMGSFTADQLREIKKVTLSKIICNNSNLKKMPYGAMLYPDDKINPYANCKDLRGINLTAWMQ